MPSSPTGRPRDRDPVPTSFVLNYDDRIQASFDVVIGDPQVAKAILNGTTPPVRPVIGGVRRISRALFCDQPAVGCSH